MFTVSVILVLDSKYVQFRIICSLLCCTTINTFKVDPHSIQYEKCLVKPTNTNIETLFHDELLYLKDFVIYWLSLHELNATKKSLQ